MDKAVYLCLIFTVQQALDAQNGTVLADWLEDTQISKPQPVKHWDPGRQRAKRRSLKTHALLEATITQLTNTVGDANLFNTSHCKTEITNPLKGRQRAKGHAAKTSAQFQATIE